MRRPENRRWRRLSQVTLVISGILGALALRWLLRDHESPDYVVKLSRWWDFIQEHGRIAAHQYAFTDYSPPYVWLLSAATTLDPWVPKLYAIKATSVLFDFVLAYFVFRCVRVKYPEPSSIPSWAGIATLFAPTVVMNSAMWGQADAIYTAFLAAALWCLLQGRSAWGSLCLGVSFAIKPWAIFLAPVFFWLLLKRTIRWREVLVWPAVYLLSLLPHWWLGRPWGELLAIYFRPTTAHRFLATDTPTLYALVPTYLDDWFPLFLAAAAVVVLLIAEFLFRSRREIDADRLVLLAAFSVLLVPWIMPKMLGRSFFPADVLSIVLAFYFPRFWYVPVICGLTSTVHYFHILQVTRPIPAPWLAPVMLALITAVAVRVRREFEDRDSRDADRPSEKTRRGRSAGLGWHRLRWSPAVQISVPAVAILVAFAGHRVSHTERERLWVENSGHLRDALLGQWDEPTVESHFNLYWLEDALFYRRSPCSEEDLATSFFVHVDAIARPTRDNDTREFGSVSFGLMNGECLGRLPLPGVDGAAAITTGQRGSPGRPPLWKARIPLELDSHRAAFDAIASGGGDGCSPVRSSISTTATARSGTTGIPAPPRTWRRVSSLNSIRQHPDERFGISTSGSVGSSKTKDASLSFRSGKSDSPGCQPASGARIAHGASLCNSTRNAF